MYYEVLRFGDDPTVGSSIHIRAKWRSLSKLCSNDEISSIRLHIWNWGIKFSLGRSVEVSAHAPPHTVAGHPDSLENSNISKNPQTSQK